MGRLRLKGNKRGIGLKFALEGLIVIFKEERNFRIHFLFACLAIIIGFVLKLNQNEWLIIVITIHIVILMEIMNSIIERMIDYIKPDIHPIAKKIKDMAAAAVLIAAVMSIIVGLIIFIPKLYILIHK